MTHNNNGSLRTIEWAIPIIFLSVILPFSGAAQKEEPESIVPADAANRLCQSVRVCGVVAEVNSALQDFNRSAPAFLNLERPYPEQPLTLIILAADRSKFDELDAYKRKQVCVSGTVTDYHGMRAIVVKQPNDIAISSVGRVSFNKSSSTLETPDAGRLSVTLKKDTRVALRLAETVRSSSAPGTPIDWRVFREVRVAGLAVIPRGAHASGIIDLATEPSRNFGREGFLRTTLREVLAIDNQSIQLLGSTDSRGSVFGGVHPIELLFLPFAKGGEGTIPRGTKGCALVAADRAFSIAELELLNRNLGPVAATNNKASPVVYIYLAGELAQVQKFYHQVENVGNSKQKLYIDGVFVAEFPYPKFIGIETLSGSHTVALGKLSLKVEVKDGEEYFLRAEPLRKHIELVNTELGEDEVFALESVDLREVSPEWRRSVRVDGPLMKR